MKKKILFISPEVSPYTENSVIADYVMSKAKKLSAKGNEIRIFIPKYNSIKDRKHHLHEVLRLSGLNVDVNGSSQPLILKVATVPKEKIQIYFIHNEDFFAREGEIFNVDGNMFKDAEERCLLYCKSTLEIIKKLNWSPDFIVLSGWMSYLSVPFLKNYFEGDDTFKNSYLVINYFNEKSFDSFETGNLSNKLHKSGISKDYASMYGDTYESLLRNTILNSNYVICENSDLLPLRNNNNVTFVERTDSSFESFFLDTVIETTEELEEIEEKYI